MKTIAKAVFSCVIHSAHTVTVVYQFSIMFCNIEPLPATCACFIILIIYFCHVCSFCHFCICLLIFVHSFYVPKYLGESVTGVKLRVQKICNGSCVVGYGKQVGDAGGCAGESS